ncbi:MAG: hypothetical protein Q8P55_00260, partial [bacterium]|nr:hypothetical protein [bacterium]
VLRILNEEGDTQNAFDPIIRLENGACLNGSDDTQIGEIDFVVTQDQTEFLFLPSRESDAAFLIRVTDKNMLEVEQIPAEG